MIRAILNACCLIALVGCSTYSLPGYRDDRILPIFAGYWADLAELRSPGVQFDFPDPLIKEIYAVKREKYWVWPTSEYKLVANDLDDLTSVILVKDQRDRDDKKKGYVYQFRVLKYLPAGGVGQPREDGYPVLYIYYYGWCSALGETTVETWNNFDPVRLAPYFRKGAPCHYDNVENWSSRGAYVR